METATKTVHLGRKVARLRELRGIKQDALAFEMGVSQQTISKLENSENVADDMLEKVGKVLGFSVEAIKNFSEESVFNNINNTFHEGSSLINYQFNPIDKIVELYERLVQTEKEKVEMLEKLLRDGR